MFKCLVHFYGFGESLTYWIKEIYSDISSCILNNQHCSKFYKLQRGDRQRDPISPNLFILCLEFLIVTNKNSLDIENEILRSQYVDDSTLTSDDNKLS